MKRIGSLVANVVVLFPLEDVNPERGVSPQVVAEAITARYSFKARPMGTGRGLTFALPAGSGVGLPTLSGTSSSLSFGVPSFVGMSPAMGMVPGSGSSVATGISTPVSFRNGILTAQGEAIAITQLDLSIESDPGSIAVQCSTTETGDLVIDDILEAMESELGFRNLRQVSSREYLSNVVVTFEQGIEERIKALGAIQEVINAALGTRAVGPLGFERITFGTDLTRVPLPLMHAAQGFVLERRANHPFSENRYFSSAPLKTSDHFETLEKVAAIIEKGAG